MSNSRMNLTSRYKSKSGQRFGNTNRHSLNQERNVPYQTRQSSTSVNFEGPTGHLSGDSPEGNKSDNNKSHTSRGRGFRSYDARSDYSLPSKPDFAGTKSEVSSFTSTLTDKEKSEKGDLNSTNNLNKKGTKQDTSTTTQVLSCITEIEGDLFSATADFSLAHCVGADFSMGLGIAPEFCQKFKSVGELLDQRKGPGGVAHIQHKQRYIFYLVTKQASKDKPEKHIMKKSLLALHGECQKLNVTKLAMPRIGCGLDGLLWKDVKEMIEEIFVYGYTIKVYHLDSDSVNTTKSISKSRVKNEQLLLKDIERDTGLLYIGCADLSVTEEMKSLNEKYPFLNHLKTKKSLKPGFAFFTKIHGTDDIVYGLICKTSADKPLSYRFLESAIEDLKKHNMKHKYEYFGIQAFEEKDDPDVMNKINILFKNSLMDVEFWICWPPSSINKCSTEQDKKYESIEMTEDRNPHMEENQSQSLYQLNIPHESSGEKNIYDTSKVVNKYSNVQNNLNTANQGLKDVEEKMKKQSLGDGTELERSELGQNSFSTADDSQRSMECQSVVESVSDEDNGYWNMENSVIENEKKLSKEKKETNRKHAYQEKSKINYVKPKSCITEYTGDLFEAEDTVCLAHCVGADFRMGSGIAVRFRQEFGAIGELLNQRVTQGGVAYIEHEKRYIFYLVTKKESTGKPTNETLKKSLIALHRKCKKLNVTELAMPRIGCGLDRLSWSDVRAMLEEIFVDGFSIRIYTLDKDSVNTTKSSSKSRVKNEQLLLKDIERGTGLLYIGCADLSVTEEMKSLNEKYPFLNHLKTKKSLKPGFAFFTKIYGTDDIVYGLICKASADKPLSYRFLESAIEDLKKHNMKHKYGYFGIQAFTEKDDPDVMNKINILFKNSLMDVEFWICWPPSLINRCSTEQPMYHSPKTSENRKITTYQERHYIELPNIETNLERELKHALDRENELKEKLKNTTSELNNIYTEFDSFRKENECFKQKCFLQETENSDLKTKIEHLERMLHEQELVINRSNYSSNFLQSQHRDYRNSDTGSFQFGPNSHQLSFLPQEIGQVYPNPGMYYNKGLQYVKPPIMANARYTYYPHTNPAVPHDRIMRTVESLPEEKQALRHVTKKFATSHGYEIYEASDKIFIKTDENSEPWEISGYRDLNNIENLKT